MRFNCQIVGNIMKAIRIDNVAEVCRLVREIGENNEELKGHSPLYIACAAGILRWVKFLVEKGGMDFNEKSKNGVTSLEIATQSEKTDIVEYFRQELQKRKEEEQLKKVRLQEIQSINALIEMKRQEIKSLKIERDQNALDLMDKITQERFQKIEDSISNQS